MSSIITLTTDFGTRDYYVGAMKGVILDINPTAQLIDICHTVSSYDILEGALTLAHTYPYFPAGTVHVVVVDPGVGTARRPIVVTAGRHIFVAPDNGILSLVYAREGRVVVRHLTASHYFRQPVSPTFHGRDVFAPIAGYLSREVPVASLGEEITDYVRYSLRAPKQPAERTLQGTVLRVDHFGNLVTNIGPQDAPQLFATPPAPFRMAVGKGEVNALRSTFAEGKPGEVFAILGSMGFVEIVAHRASAAQILAASKGSEVVLTWQ